MDSNAPQSGDPLEAELAVLRPVSVGPAVVSRIRIALEGDDADAFSQAHLRRRRIVWIIGSVAAGVAAAIAVATLIPGNPFRQERPDVALPGGWSGPHPPRIHRAAAPEPPVTLAAYRAALAHSPEEALALLDRRTPPSTSPAEGSPRAFGRLAMATARSEADTP